MFQLPALTALTWLPVVLTLTLFVSVMMTVSRSYKDSEMVVWSASGVSLFAWVGPVLIFAAPIFLLSALLGLFLSPWTNECAQEYRRQLDSPEEVSRIAPGVFRVLLSRGKKASGPVLAFDLRDLPDRAAKLPAGAALTAELPWSGVTFDEVLLCR